MKCVRHSDRDVVGTCPVCGGGLCPACFGRYPSPLCTPHVALGGTPKLSRARQFPGEGACVAVEEGC
jgi:hypothetical protein